MIKKIDHVVITAKNPLACIAFYESLGFCSSIAEGRYELFAGDFKINVHIAGKELFPHATNVQPGSADFCFEINDSLSKFKSNLEAKGIVIELGIVQRMGVKGRMHSLYLRDTEGNLLEFCSYEFSPEI